MNTAWIALIVMHQQVGSLGSTEQYIGTGQYVNETEELCKADGANAVAFMERKDLLHARYSFKCVELQVNTTVWTPPEQR